MSTYDYLLDLARQALDARDQIVERLLLEGSRSELRARARRQRAFFRTRLGALPRRTDLRARTVGRLRGEGYRIEKVVFESEPGIPVTANLYLPARGPRPCPAVLVPSGHHDLGKAAETYQRICILLARTGMAAFCYDPISQGERYQLLTEAGTRRFWPTYEHTLTGVGAILLGSNTARRRVWDGMRALDYLQSRSDLDPRRLGCTGNSGGGTLTSYLLALDGRLACAAPSCYLTSLRRFLETIGPQDAEQNISGQVAAGMDHADYLFMGALPPSGGAPTPTLISAASRDFFDQRGTWDTFRQAKRLYTRLGHPERLDLVEAPEEHGFSLPLRQAVASWMRRWLLGVDEPVTEAPTRIHTETELACTPRGQVQLVPGVATAFARHAVIGDRLRARRQSRPLPAAAFRQQVRELIGAPRWGQVPAPEATATARRPGSGYTSQNLSLRTDLSPDLPTRLLRPRHWNGTAVLWADGGRARAASRPAGQLARSGHLVLAVDLSELGQLRQSVTRSSFLAYLLDRSLLGQRVAELLACTRYLVEQACPRAPAEVHLVGVGEAGVAALHAAALEPRRFSRVSVRRSLHAWADLLTNEATPLEQMAQVVHGALQHYDLPELQRLVPAGRLEVVEPVDAAGRAVVPDVNPPQETTRSGAPQRSGDRAAEPRRHDPT